MSEWDYNAWHCAHCGKELNSYLGHYYDGKFNCQPKDSVRPGDILHPTHKLQAAYEHAFQVASAALHAFEADHTVEWPPGMMDRWIEAKLAVLKAKG